MPAPTRVGPGSCARQRLPLRFHQPQLTIVMKPTLRLLSLSITIVLVLQAISALAARRTVIRTAAAQSDNQEETFVISREGDGKTVCRIANAEEHDRMVSRDRNGKFK